MTEIKTCLNYCPYCGERIELMVEALPISQSYIEDCAVCCRPIQVRCETESDGDLQVQLFDENEALG